MKLTVSYDLRFGVGVSTILLFGGVLHNITDLENHLGGFRNQKILRKAKTFEFLFDKIPNDNGKQKNNPNRAKTGLRLTWNEKNKRRK